MTELENKVHDIDKRQDSFETFVRAYIAKTDEHMDRMEKRMDRLEDDMKELRKENREILSNIQTMIWNSIYAWAGGVIAILIAIYVSSSRG